MYNEKVQELKMQGLIGLVIGMAIGIFFCIENGSFYLAALILFPIFFAGSPYGWQKFGRVFNFLLIGPVPIMLIGFMIRVTCSILIGWFIYPIALIWNIIQAKDENSADS